MVDFYEVPRRPSYNTDFLFGAPLIAFNSQAGTSVLLATTSSGAVYALNAARLADGPTTITALDDLDGAPGALQLACGYTALTPQGALVLLSWNADKFGRRAQTQADLPLLELVVALDVMAPGPAPLPSAAAGISGGSVAAIVLCSVLTIGGLVAAHRYSPNFATVVNGWFASVAGAITAYSDIRGPQTRGALFTSSSEGENAPLHQR